MCLITLRSYSDDQIQSQGVFFAILIMDTSSIQKKFDATMKIENSGVAMVSITQRLARTNQIHLVWF